MVDFIVKGGLANNFLKKAVRAVKKTFVEKAENA
jgi:hypothetical protein